MPTRPSRGARALRWTALVWGAAALVGLVLDLAVDRLLEARRESDAPFEEIVSTMALYQWTSVALSVGATVVALVLSWSWMPREGVRAALGRTGFVLTIVQLVLMVGNVALQSSFTRSEDFDLLAWFHFGRFVLSQAGLALLLGGTPGPRWRAAAYATLASAWIVTVGWERLGGDPIELGVVTHVAIVLALELGWAVGMWMGAAHCVAAPDEAVGDVAVERRQAASGLRIVRAAFLSRIAISLVGMAVVVASRGSGDAGHTLWLTTCAGLVASVAIGVGLSRYSSLKTEAVSRTAISLALIGLGVGAMLDLVAAQATVSLLEWSSRVRDASSPFGMPSMAEAARIQSRMQWSGGLGGLAGIVTAIAITVSLRATAGWLRDEESIRHADRVIALTMFGAAIAIGGVSLAASAAGGSAGVLGVLAFIALGLAIWLLVSYLALFGSLVDRLERPSPVDDVSP